jgi:C1A family cysteine protease
MSKNNTNDQKDISENFININDVYKIKIFDQYDLGSCTAFALIYIYKYFLHVEKNINLNGSSLFLYYNARLILGEKCNKNMTNDDTGFFIENGLKALEQYGLCSNRVWGYKNYEKKFNVQPSNKAYEQAKLYKLSKEYIKYVYPSVDNLKKILQMNIPYCYNKIIGIFLY